MSFAYFLQISKPQEKDGAEGSFDDASTADAATVINNAGGKVDLSHMSTGLSIGSLSGAGKVNLGGQTLTLGGLNGNDTVSGVIADGGDNGGTGGSLVKVGTGTLILNGINTYTGLSTVNAGTFEVGDINTPTARIAGNVQVNAAGTLRGHGTVGGSVINDGTVRPGGSLGTLTIAGDYTQGPGCTLMIDVSPTAVSQLKVGGTATLGGTLSVLYGPGTYTTTSYQLISAGAVKGAFATVTGNTPSGFAQSVTLGATGTLNLAGAGSVIVDPTNATLFGAVGSAALRAGQQVNDDLMNRLSRPCLSPTEEACVQPNRSVWIQANGTDTRIDGNHGAPDVHDQRYGFLAGVDRELKNGWTVGVAAGYSDGDVRENGTGATGKLDTLRLAGYVGKRLGRVNVAGTVGYAYDTLSTTRPFGAFGSAKGSGHGQEWNAGVQASLPWSVGRVIVTPRSGLRYAHVEGLGLNETGVE